MAKVELLWLGSMVAAGLLLFSCGREAAKTQDQRPVPAAPPLHAAPTAAVVPSGTAADAEPHLYGRRLALYGQVDKAGDYFRRMFVDLDTIASWDGTSDLPDGTMLVMEVWHSEGNQSTIYTRELRNATWLSGSFPPTRPDFSTLLIASCNDCHAAAASRQSTFTSPMLRAWRDTKRLQRVSCEEYGFTPCELDTYGEK
jgi:hypothetical protein